MIRVPFAWAVVSLLFLTVFTLLMAWALQRAPYKRKKRERIRAFKCPICAYTYITESKEILKCPRCGSLAEKGEAEQVSLKRDWWDHP